MKINVLPSAKKAGSKAPTAASRKALASNGQAMSDGSFPIPNLDYLKRAIRSIGRAAPGKRAAVVAWIKKRASALGQPQLAANLSNAADKALEMANKRDAVELAGALASTGALITPKGGSGASKKPPKSKVSGGGLKTAKGKAIYAKLCAKGFPSSLAMKAAKKVEQGLNVDEMANSPKV